MSDQDLLQYLSELPVLEKYLPNDRYHDFVNTFKTHEGQRVLRYILERGGVFNDAPITNPIDPHLASIERGKRRLALEILSYTYNEPPPKPTKQKRVNKNA